MIALTSFATEDFIPAQSILTQSALLHGARRTSMWRRENITCTELYANNRAILDRYRGAGYWLWKPYIILAELENLHDGDFLIYSDCGRWKANRISRPLTVLTDWCHDHNGGMLPGVYIPQSGRNAKWTKGECFTAMGCDSDFYKDHPQIQSTFSVWQKHQASIDFVRDWLHWCADPAALIDDPVDPSIPDSPDFRDHRHDQSIVTLLALKQGLKCFGAPWEGHQGSKGINNLIDRITGRAQAESFAERYPALSGV